MDSLVQQFLSKKYAHIDLMVLRIVIMYFVFGLLWIVFSDGILQVVISDKQQFIRFSLYKGWAYIVITSVFLYLLVRKTFKQQMQIEDTLKVSEERWKFALEGAGHGVWDWDLLSNEVFRSARWKEIYGYTDDQIAPTPEAGRELMHPEDRERAVREVEASLAQQQDMFVSEFRLRCGDGSWKWTLSRGMLIFNEQGKAVRMIGTHTDISARKLTEAQVTRLAHYDVVTDLPNRVLFLDRFKQEIKKGRRGEQTITLMYLDLDHFKEINDTFGHDKGDLLLKEGARRLLSCVREVDTVARLGGDEFTVILDNLENKFVTERIAEDILSKFAQPFQLDDELVYISTSIGISVYPADGEDVEVLLKNADQAMYAAKQDGRNRFHYFTPQMQEAASSRMRLISDLHMALGGDQLRLYYQPIVELSTGHIHKAEALVRWQHPTRGLVSPAEFIPVAEDTGLIVEIGDWVFYQAVQQVAKWRAHHPNFQISVNKSPVQFRSGGAGHIAWMAKLAELNIPGRSIAIEITEGLLLDARESVTSQFSHFRDGGVQIAIDDFGTGYSSLAYLRKFNIDFLKIDQSFIANITSESSNLALCEAIIVMGHKMGMKVIAEGIETNEQLQLLLSAGCDYGQGYFFSRPVPAEDFERMLTLPA